ncbi:MAG: hypothetical protein RIG63_26550 [Coleofasciculus chthonoplastes F3-SA18-01]|uniref:hypothetical protein n=1 Tax=Coleofasciculus chthonoplastes TaxID=64178 RepID=UPI0032F1545F
MKGKLCDRDTVRDVSGKAPFNVMDWNCRGAQTCALLPHRCVTYNKQVVNNKLAIHPTLNRRLERGEPIAG